MDEVVEQNGQPKPVGPVVVPRAIRLEAELLQKQMENINLRMQALQLEAQICAGKMAKFAEQCRAEHGFDLTKSRIADDGTVLPVVGPARQGG